MAEKLFVYGTLKQGEGNHALLQEARFIQQDTLPGRLYLFGHGRFPYAVPLSRSGGHTPYFGEIPRIYGEVYEVEPVLLARLDRLEGTPIHYERPHQYQTDGGLWVWVYQPTEITWMRANEIHVIRSGCFRDSHALSESI